MLLQTLVVMSFGALMQVSPEWTESESNAQLCSKVFTPNYISPYTSSHCISSLTLDNYVIM